MCSISPMPRRSAFGPRSRKRAGSQVSHRWAGSTRWSSTLMIFGSGVVLPSRGVVSSIRSVMAAPVWPRTGPGGPATPARPGPGSSPARTRSTTSSTPRRGVVLELGPVREGAEGDHAQGGRVAAGLLGPGGQAGHGLGQAAAADREPPVGVGHYGREHGLARAATDERAHPRLLDRLGPGPRRAEVDELAVELGLLGRPDGLHGGQVLAHDDHRRSESTPWSCISADSIRTRRPG